MNKNKIIRLILYEVATSRQKPVKVMNSAGTELLGV